MDKKKLRSAYVLEALNRYCLGGDAYASRKKLFEICKLSKKELNYDEFSKDLNEQISLGWIFSEGDRLYVTKIWRYEERAAQKLAEIRNNCVSNDSAPLDKLTVNGIALTPEQCKAVSMALSNRLTMILGGAGTGKTTLIGALALKVGNLSDIVLCAPTGKAAKNLTEKTGLSARTVHSALGKIPNDDFLEAVVWSNCKLLIIDEASMLTTEMLAGVLETVPPSCCIVLVGDENQLQSVGAGNVIRDLISIGVPFTRLKELHRQADALSGLANNVFNFSSIKYLADIRCDESFVIEEISPDEVLRRIVADAVKLYRSGESVQVLSPYRKTVMDLNQMIRNELNPKSADKLSFQVGDTVFRDGDRVMITVNDRDKSVVNGDVGILKVINQDKRSLLFSVVLASGRIVSWDSAYSEDGVCRLVLAYALTVHKAQGSEFDTVLMPVTMLMQRMLYRNLIYTAISRAKKKIVIYGSKEAVNIGLQKTPPERKSMLPEKTMMFETMCA